MKKEEEKRSYSSENKKDKESSINNTQGDNGEKNKANDIQKVALEKSIKIFISRLEKIPVDEKEAAYAKLEKNITSQLEVAKKRKSKLLVMKLEAFLEILGERMDEGVDDESLVNSLF